MRKIAVFVVAAVLLVLLLPTAVYAQAPPALPDAFQGTVMINGVAAADGTTVSATVSSGTIINNVQNPVATVGGSYGIHSVPLLVQGDIPNGATITFHVNNSNGTAIAAVTAIFAAGGGPNT